MSDKLSCHIVKDLLPLMADGLVSEETSQEINEHLETCEDCRRAYAAMTGAEETAQQEQKAQDEAQIDYLKKVRKRSKLPAVMVACAAVLVLAVLVVKIFVTGRSDVQLYVSAEPIGTRSVNLAAVTYSSSQAISGIDVTENDGVLTVCAKTVPVAIRWNDTYVIQYTARSEIKQIVDATGRVLWEKGVVINEHVGTLFTKKVKYVGNASAVSELNRAVWGYNSVLTDGPMTLQTKTEPYGVQFVIGNGETRVNIQDTDVFSRYIMRKHACKILALVENLGYVEYKVVSGGDDSGEKEVFSFKVTAEEALEYAKKRAADLPSDSVSAKAVLEAKSIKDFAESASALEYLDEVLMTGGPIEEMIDPW